MWFAVQTSFEKPIFRIRSQFELLQSFGMNRRRNSCLNSKTKDAFSEVPESFRSGSSRHRAFERMSELRTYGSRSAPKSHKRCRWMILNRNLTVRLRGADHQVSCWYLPSFSMLSRYLSAALSSILPSSLKTSASAARTALGIFPEDPHT